MSYARENIRVNSIHPGVIETPMSGETTWERALEALPMGRLGRPEEVASAALFLASDEASYITGVELFVDGGSGTKA
jgi:NAD(P)-dependent dehydrogenase (short-subunit alcohol dehydrogenase family)